MAMTRLQTPPTMRHFRVLLSITCLWNCYVSCGAWGITRPPLLSGQQRQRGHRSSAACPTCSSMVGGQFSSSNDGFLVKEITLYEEVQEIVRLASQALPERPDGIVTVLRYSSRFRSDCQATEGEYDRLARSNPATLFLRVLQEYEGADLLFGQANIQSWPTVDIFYGGNRVARVEGSAIQEVQDVLDRYQLQNSSLDLFSESSSKKWGEQRNSVNATPRTTNRFVPGYDSNKNGGFFDEQASAVEQSFEETFGNWVPNIDDDDA